MTIKPVVSLFVFSSLVFCQFVTAFAQLPDGEVAAVVGDEKIHVSQVDHDFQKKFADRHVGEELKTGLRFQILQKLCKQQLIMERLKGSDSYGTDDEVDLEISRLRERLKSIEKKLEVFLTENGQSMAGLRFNLRWQISWKRYLDRTLSDDVIEKYFERNRKRFDGTRVRAAHILLTADKDDPEAMKVAKAQAEKLRLQIADGELTWEQAVTRRSQAPSAKESGNVGWIEFSGPMSRNFTDTAFQMEIGQVSHVVTTPFGIHLIKCTELQQGTASWYDVKEEIKRVATLDLFERVSSTQRPKTEVRLTGVIAKDKDE